MVWWAWIWLIHEEQCRIESSELIGVFVQTFRASLFCYYRCFVIIDEYHSVCCTAMFEVHEKPLTKIFTFLLSMVGINENPFAGNPLPLEDIIWFFLTILDRVLKQNETYVRSGFITGISYIGTAGLSKFNNIAGYRFLQNKKCFPYYGLMMDEVEDLMKRFSIPPKEKAEIVSYYNGYSCCGKEIFSIWSVMHYLKTQELRKWT